MPSLLRNANGGAFNGLTLIGRGQSPRLRNPFGSILACGNLILLKTTRTG